MPETSVATTSHKQTCQKCGRVLSSVLFTIIIEEKVRRNGTFVCRNHALSHATVAPHCPKCFEECWDIEWDFE